MKRNAMRIVSNPLAKHISYYFKNEFGKWCVLSASSPLSRQYYTATTMQERSEDIVRKIDEIYNRRNKGLDIFFEGDEQNYKLFEKSVKEYLPRRNIDCHLGATKVIVTGKAGVGKTTLIKEMEKAQNLEFTITDFEDYVLYRDTNNTEWYEIKGIDLGIKNVNRAYETINNLSRENATMIVYCLEATHRRMEEVERNFILQLVSSFPEIAGMLVLTQCTQKRGLQDFIDEIEKMTELIKVVPVLAQEFQTDLENETTGELITLKPFGLEKLAEYIFEGR